MMENSTGYRKKLFNRSAALFAASTSFLDGVEGVNSDIEKVDPINASFTFDFITENADEIESTA